MVSGTKRRPDFLITEPSNAEFVLEATTAAGKTEQQQAADRRMEPLLDALRRICHPDFWITLTIRGRPNDAPPTRKIVGELCTWLDTIEPNSIQNDGSLEARQGGPQWKYSADGLTLIFRVLLKGPEIRGKPEESSWGAYTEGGRKDSSGPIESAIRKKATAYGSLKCPYVVAILCLGYPDRRSIADALFGKEQVILTTGPGSPVGKPRVERRPDGALVRPFGPQNTRVSAVLVATLLVPWAIQEAKVSLWHNPWAKHPYTGVLTELPQYVPQNNQMVAVEGRGLRKILGLP